MDMIDSFADGYSENFNLTCHGKKYNYIIRVIQLLRIICDAGSYSVSPLYT